MFKTLTNFYRFSTQAFDASKNYYSALNINQDATPSDIKSSFKKLAKQYHPDFNKGKEEDFKRVNEAYQILSDQSLKKQYDEARRYNSGNLNQNANNPYDRSHTQNYHQQRHPFGNPFEGHSKTGSNQQSYYYKYQGPYGYQEYYSVRNPKERQYQRQRNYAWSKDEQLLFQMLRKQQSQFNNRYQESLKSKFSRSPQGSYSPLHQQFVRQYMEEFLKQQQKRKTEEQFKQERERQQRQEREKIQKQFKENLNKIKQTTKVLSQNVKGLFKGLWEAYVDPKDPKDKK